MKENLKKDEVSKKQLNTVKGGNEKNAAERADDYIRVDVEAADLIVHDTHRC